MSTTDDIQIYLGDAKTNSAVEEQPPPASGLATYVAVYGDAANAQLPVYVHEAALESIERHAASSLEAEVGGALLGGIYRWQGTPYVRVDAHLPARNADEKRSSLTFTHETWSQLNEEREAKCPSLRMVGWYHTHPNLGVFLSDKDRFIQQSFFAQPEQVALVIDSVSNERAFFHLVGETLSKLPGFYVFGDVSKSCQIDQKLAEMQNKRIWTAPPANPPTRVVNNIVFSEPCINLYYVLPSSLRRLLGVMNCETAPRVSVKSLVIWVLLLALLYQMFVSARPPAMKSTYDAGVHLKFASAFVQADDDEEAVREYRRYLALRQNDTGARRDLLAALARLSAAKGGDAYAAFRAEVTRTRQMAEQAAVRKHYGQAYDLYSAIIDIGIPDYDRRVDVACRNVFGYLARKLATPPVNADRREVISRFPHVADALREMDANVRKERQRI